MLALLADIDVSMVAVEPASEAESLTEPASEARECPSDAVAEKSGTIPNVSAPKNVFRFLKVLLLYLSALCPLNAHAHQAFDGLKEESSYLG